MVLEFLKAMLVYQLSVLGFQLETIVDVSCDCDDVPPPMYHIRGGCSLQVFVPVTDTCDSV